MFTSKYRYSVSFERTKEENWQCRTSNQSARKETGPDGRRFAGHDQLIIGPPDITIDEIIEKQGLSVSNETVRKAVIRLGYVYKKKSFYAAEREKLGVK